MLALGASGAVFGTRFLLSEESLYNSNQKEALKQATDPNATVRTMVFDEVRGFIAFVHNVASRCPEIMSAAFRFFGVRLINIFLRMFFLSFSWFHFDSDNLP
jgi:hypothetical protein